MERFCRNERRKYKSLKYHVVLSDRRSKNTERKIQDDKNANRIQVAYIAKAEILCWRCWCKPPSTFPESRQDIWDPNVVERTNSDRQNLSKLR